MQNALRAIQERFLGGSHSQQRRSYANHQESNAPRSNYPQAQEDDEWDNPVDQSAFSKPAAHFPKQNNDWDESNLQRESNYQPSANTYQRESSGYSQPQRGFNRSERSGFDNRSSSFDNNYDGGRSNSYGDNQGTSSNAYRSFDDPPKQEDKFEPIDWDEANRVADEARKARWEKCPLMVKNFYIEHPDVTNMTDEEVEKFRADNKNITVTRTFGEGNSDEPMPKPTTKFEHAFEKFPDLMTEIKKAGFEKPSPIQSQMWPILLQGEDCIGIAQTGTGKTLAFLLPALIHTDGQPHPRGIKARGGPNVLVLAPTRELAIQIEKEVGKYQFRNIRA